MRLRLTTEEEGSSKPVSFRIDGLLVSFKGLKDGCGGLRGTLRRILSICILPLALAACGGGNAGQPSVESCAGPYPEQASSPYVLPYEVGASFLVGQGNCTSRSHAAGTQFAFAYDLLMPIGTNVIAARGGTVFAIEESFLDTDHTSSHENFVKVQHSDGTVADYVHLTTGGALVNVGDIVAQGDVIALSGNSGDSTAPHLHFAVHGCRICPSVPVTFRNTRPHPNGLVEGQSYLADPFSLLP